MLVRSSLQVPFVNSTESAIEAGEAVKIGGIFGIAPIRVEAGKPGVLETTGTWTLPCANTLTASAGDVAKWSGSAVVAASGTGSVIGYFVNAVTAGVTEVEILVIPTVAAATE